MKNYELYQKELQRLQNIRKLKWNNKKRTWNKKFYPDYDDDGNFIRFKFGVWFNHPLCLYCGTLLETVEDNPSRRASKYCSIPHSKLYQTIRTRAMKRFNLTDFDIQIDNPKTFKNWYIAMPNLYETFRDKEGKMKQKKIKNKRIESRDIVVVIDGKSFPYTTKSRTI